jgi:LuxR family transcriptional regulator, quorum-sensing system regulator SdiA
MASMPPITAQIKQHLDRLRCLSNTGYALAIHIRYTRPTLLYRTYAQDWIDHYSEQGFMLCDPVVRWGLNHTGMVEWSELTESDPKGVFAAASSHGLLNGLTYSTGGTASRTISGHTRCGPAFTQAERDEFACVMDDIHRLTENFDSLPEVEQAGLRGLH